MNPAVPPARPTPTQAWSLVGVLCFAYAVSFLDRSVIVLLLEPIKQHFGVSDTALGLLHGFGFVLFYLMLGVPIGRLVDRRSRKLIVGVGVVFWSLMTAACGLATSFLWLLLARLGVGAGEATLGPAAFSMIGDALPKRDQPRALAIYAMGISFGSGMALIVGGWLLDRLADHSLPVWTGLSGLAPWQAVCVLASLPGFLVAALIAIVREPARQQLRSSESIPGGGLKGIAVKEVIAYVRGNVSAYVGVIGGFSLVILAGYGVGTWIPTFLVRTYALSMSEIGITYGAISVTSGITGALIAARAAKWLADRGRDDAAILLIVVALVGSIVITPVYVLAPSANISFAALAVSGVFGGIPFGAAAAAVNQMTPGQMRGQLSAVFHLVINLIGVGFGPIIVGVLSDQVFTQADGVRYSILAVNFTFTPIAVLGLLFSRPAFLRACNAAERWSTAQP